MKLDPQNAPKTFLGRYRVFSPLATAELPCAHRLPKRVEPVRFDLLPGGQLHPQEEELHLAVGHLLVDLLIGPAPIFGDLKEHRNVQNVCTKKRKTVEIVSVLWNRFGLGLSACGSDGFLIGPAPILCV